MAKAPKVKSLSDIVANTDLPRRRMWTDKLAPTEKEDIEQLRRDFHAGKFLHPGAVLVRAIKKKYPHLPWSEDYLARWLRAK